MRFDILTLFPALFDGVFTESILNKARERGFLFVDIHDIREETHDKHQSADDSPFGGGPGMVMLADPIIRSIDKLKTKGSHTIFLCPSGVPLTQDKVKELSKYEHLILVCGHYEGMDERAYSLADEKISLGDYVLTGGELPAAVLVDAVSRYIPGVVKEMDSVEQDSFHSGLLDHPHYTRPRELNGVAAPDVLLNGNHEDIRRWRRKMALKRTLLDRADLFGDLELTAEDQKLLEEIVKGI